MCFSQVGYAKIHIDVECLESNFKAPKCHPFASNYSKSSSDTLSSIFFEKGDSFAYYSNLADLIASMALNGLPLLDLDDYVRLSDATNEIIGRSVRDRLVGNLYYGGKVDNLLEVRRKQIVLAPRNCWTQHFLSSLLRSSDTAKVLFFIFTILYTIENKFH